MVDAWNDTNPSHEALRQLVKNKQVVDAFTGNLTPAVTGRKKALCIGISYHADSSGQLTGTIPDAKLFSKALGDLGFEVTQLFDDPDPANCSKENIFAAFADLVKDAKKGDCLWLSYSGHGCQAPGDHYGTRHEGEADGKDEAICCPGDLGYIIDDEIMDRLVLTLPEGVKLTCVFDCCHSGTIMDLPYQWCTDQDEFKRFENPILVPADVLAISGCQDDQVSWESGMWIQGRMVRGGHLTLALCKHMYSIIGNELNEDGQLEEPLPSIGAWMDAMHEKWGERNGGVNMKGAQHFQIGSSQPRCASYKVDLDGNILPNKNSQLGLLVNDGEHIREFKSDFHEDE